MNGSLGIPWRHYDNNHFMKQEAWDSTILVLSIHGNVVIAVSLLWYHVRCTVNRIFLQYI